MIRAIVFCVVCLVQIGVNAAPLNTLSADERKGGWRLLFDGKTLNGWRNYHEKQPGTEWKVSDGAIVLNRHSEPGESGELGEGLMTEEEFGDFDLQIEWRVAPGANSGILYRVSESADQAHKTGIEYQVLDNKAHPDAKRAVNRQAGACYGLYAPVRDVTRPVGEWNTARIVVHNNHVEHWMNGTKLLSFELGSADWQKRIDKSKFKEFPDFGKAAKGHILLQDHQHHVEFRNIKIHVLK